MCLLFADDVILLASLDLDLNPRTGWGFFPPHPIFCPCEGASKRLTGVSGRAVLYRTVSIYQSIYIPTVTCGHGLSVMTKNNEMAGRPVSALEMEVRTFDIHREPGCSFSSGGARRGGRDLIRIPPGRLPSQVVQAHPTGRRPPRLTLNSLEGLQMERACLEYPA